MLKSKKERKTRFWREVRTMLYTNKGLQISEREMSFGTIRGISVGEKGRGRWEVFLPAQNCADKDTIEEGLHKDLSISLSKSGRPKIIKKEEDRIFLILDSEHAYTRRGDGKIFALTTNREEAKVIARGNGADGLAGKVGQWDAIVLEAKDGDVFRVRWGGYNYGRPTTIYTVLNGEIYFADLPDVEDLYDPLHLELPFSVFYKEGETLLSLKEWKEI